MKMILCCILYILFLACSHSNVIEYNTLKQVHKSQAICTEKIATIYFASGMVIFSVSTRPNDTSATSAIVSDDGILPRLHSHYKWQILTKYSGLEHSAWGIHLEHTAAYVLLIGVEEDFEENLHMLQKLPTWNPEAHFVILLAALDSLTEDLLISVMQILWSLYVLNAIILIPDEYDTHSFRIVTWFPYANGSCGDELLNYTYINTCTDGDFKYQTNLFPIKISDDLKGCPIKVIAIIWPPFVVPIDNFEIQNDTDIPLTNGYEVLMLKVLEEYYNCKFLFRSFSTPENWGIVNNNGTCTGMYEYLYQRNADIAIGGNFPEPTVHRYFDYSVHYLQDPQVFVLPLAPSAPGWISSYKILAPFVFLACTITLFVVCIVFYLLSINSNEPLIFKSPTGAFFTVYSLALTNFMGKFPKYYALRMILAFWFFFNINLYAIFQIGLMNTYTFELKEYQISSEDEIVQSGLTVAGIDTTVFVYSHTNDSNSKYIMEHYKDLPAKRSLEYIAEFKNISTFISGLFLSYVPEDLIRKVYVSDKPIITFPIEMLFVKGFPFKSHFNRIISICVSAGFFEKWKMQVHETHNVDETQILDIEQEIQISLSEFSGAIMLLICGYFVAIIAFLFEMYHKKGRTYLKQTKILLLNKFINYKNIKTI